MDKFQLQIEETGEFGIVEQVRHPIVVVDGLPGVSLHEVVMFENGAVGEAYILRSDHIEVLVFSKVPLQAGMRATRTGKFLSIPVGKELLGAVIDPIGNPISNIESFKYPVEQREIDAAPPSMIQRSRVKEPFLTGVSVVDMMVPLGKGQKELVIGDRKSGKTSFLLSTIKNQVKQGAIAIYAGVAKRKSDIKKIQQYLKDEKLEDRVIILASTSYDSPSVIYLTPYSAMTVAEYFRDMGEDVVLVIDDLSTHAKFYREIALLAKRFPGRDSYPGDIFHTHARLLERAGNFVFKSDEVAKKNRNEVSITVLPVAEIIEGDLAGFIPSNLMGMTDGHLFFDSNIYAKGRRPAVNISLSVTRVGRQSQHALGRSVNRELTAFLALYEKLQNLSHFGAELTDSVKHTLQMGDVIYHFFNQKTSDVIPNQVQLVLLGLIWLNYLGDVNPVKLNEYGILLQSAFEKDPKFFNDLASVENFNDFLKNITASKDRLIQICTTNAK